MVANRISEISFIWLDNYSLYALYIVEHSRKLIHNWIVLLCGTSWFKIVLFTTNRLCKATTNQPTKRVQFLDLNFMDQSITIVGWITRMPAEQIKRKKIKIGDLHHDPDVFNRLRNDYVDLAGTKKYLNSACYLYLTKKIKKLKGARRKCVKCRKNLCGEQVMCNACLQRYHITCAAYKTTQKNIVYFCMRCPLIRLTNLWREIHQIHCWLWKIILFCKYLSEKRKFRSLK